MTRRLDLIAIAGSAVAIVIHLPPEAPNVLHEIFAGPESPTMKLAESKAARRREMDMTAMADSLREIGEANGR